MKKTYITPACEAMEVKVTAPLCESNLTVSSLEVDNEQLTTGRESSTGDKDSWTDGLW